MLGEGLVMLNINVGVEFVNLDVVKIELLVNDDVKAEVVLVVIVLEVVV